MSVCTHLNVPTHHFHFSTRSWSAKAWLDTADLEILQSSNTDRCLTPCMRLGGAQPTMRRKVEKNAGLWHPAYLQRLVWNWFNDVIPWPRYNSCRKGVCGNVQFPHGCLDVSYRPWDRSKNPCLYINHTFRNSMHHQNLESRCFPGPDDAPHLEMCNFRMGMGSYYIAPSNYAFLFIDFLHVNINYTSTT